jgi:hypothetical protein
MDIFNVFSIADFLAYLFPGMLSLSGLYVILLLLPIDASIPKPPDNLGFWVFLLGLSYIFGVLHASVTDLFFREYGREKRGDKNKGNIQIKDEKLKMAVIDAFNSVFLDPPQRNIKGGKTTTSEKDEVNNWNKYCYYICRSLVIEKMPLASSHGVREGAYRQLRMNLIIPLIIWGLAGSWWGIQNWNQNIPPIWIMGRIVVFIAPIASILLIINLIIMMDIHEKREVREILSSFLAGYKTGIFREKG